MKKLCFLFLALCCFLIFTAGCAKENENDKLNNLLSTDSYSVESYKLPGNNEVLNCYNKDGKLEKVISKDKNGTIKSFEIYETDEYSNTSKITYYNQDAVVSHYCEMKYDTNGNQTQCSTFNGDGSLRSVTKSEYDQNSNNTKTSNYDSQNNLIGYETYEYNDNNKQIKNIVYSADNKVLQCYKYEYDNQSRMSKMYSLENDLQTVKEYSEYEYGENGKMTKQIRYDSKGNIIETINR